MEAKDQEPMTMWAQNQLLYKENEALKKEVQRLTEKCDMQANILRRLNPDAFPDTIFIAGVGGGRDSANMPEKLFVCPAYGCDFSYVYENTGKTIGPEW